MIFTMLLVISAPAWGQAVTVSLDRDIIAPCAELGIGVNAVADADSDSDEDGDSDEGGDDGRSCGAVGSGRAPFSRLVRFLPISRGRALR
jgi:hypothetical protein